MGAKKDPVLTPKQERFCQEFLIDLNASAAVVRAGFSPKHASEQGYQLMQKLHVQKRITELQEKRSRRTEITADMVLEELYRIASADIADAFDSQGQLLPAGKMPDGLRRAVSGIDVYKDFTEGVEIGETKKLKFWDKIRALELLGKHLKMFTDKIEHSGSVDLSEKSDAELDQEINELLGEKKNGQIEASDD